MQRLRIAFLALATAALACQVVPTPPPLKSTPRGWITLTPPGVDPGLDATLQPPAHFPGVGGPGASAPGDLPPFPQAAWNAFTASALSEWQPSPLDPAAEVSLPADLQQVANLAVAAGLTERQRVSLAQNGFVVVHSQEPQFAGIRERVSLRNGQPYYLSTDAAYHALHLALDETLAVLEREELLRRMTAVVRATLDQTLAYQSLVEGKGLEETVRLSSAYLAVALRLFDPQASLSPELEALVQPQVAQVLAGRGLEASVLFPSFRDDFAVYRPVGHYANDPALAAYYRGMTWLGRVNFSLQPPAAPAARLPLVVTLALRQAPLDPQQPGGPTAADEWDRVETALAFFTSRRQVSGPPEYAALMDRAFGSGVTVVGLADESRWELFQAFVLELPPVQSDPLSASSPDDLVTGQGWRFLWNAGPRFGLDELVFQNLLYERVGAADKRRELPSGLDYMAALGSRAALQSLEEAGETSYANYPDQLARLQAHIAMKYQSRTQSPPDWMPQAYEIWQFAFLPQLAAKAAGAAGIPPALPYTGQPSVAGEYFPAYMRTPAWEYRDLNSALGSWVSLQRETPLVDRPSQLATSSEQPVSPPAPAYVEPNPPVFYRLAYIASAAADGLDRLGMTGVFSTDPSVVALSHLRVDLLDLGDRLHRLGDIAVAELQGQELTKSQRELVQAPLGPAENRAWQIRQAGAGDQQAPLDLPPVPVIAAVPDSGGRSLQVGVGNVDRLYVLVPLDGGVQIAQGGVFSYYEFAQLRTGALTDVEWTRLLLLEPPPQPSWARNLYLPDGNPVDVIAFRLGDVYQITLAGDRLNMRTAPQRDSAAVHQLRAGEYVGLIAGPTQANGFSWWKLRIEPAGDPPVEGWAVEDPAWYQRAWGQ